MNRRQSCKSCPQVINRLRVDGDAGDNMCYFVLCFTEQCGLFAFMSQSWGPLFLCYTKANWCCWSLDTGPTPAIPQQLKLLGQARISWNLDLLPGRVSKEERRTWDLSNLFFFFPSWCFTSPWGKYWIFIALYFFKFLSSYSGSSHGFQNPHEKVRHLAEQRLLRCGEQFSSCWQPSTWLLSFVLDMAQVLQQHWPLQITAGSSILKNIPILKINCNNFF